MKILYISPWFPYPTENGSKIRIYNILRTLAPNHDIRLLSFLREDEQVDPKGLEGICSQVETIPWRDFSPRSVKSIISFFSPLPRSIIDTYIPQMMDQILRNVEEWQPDAIVANEIGTAVYIDSRINVPHILDDIEIGLFQQNWSSFQSPWFKLRRQVNWAKICRFTRNLMEGYDACTVVSDVELSLLKQISPAYNNLHLIPNGVDINHLNPGMAQVKPKTLIFNGSLRFQANFDAMQYFLNDVFPRIQAHVPDVSLKVTGSLLGVDHSKLPLNDNVTLTGFIPDIHKAVAESCVCVVPLRLGGGTRLKVMEAMALGTPVVATSKAAEGLAVTPDKNILIADSPEEFTSKVIRIIEKPGLRKHLAREGRCLVEDHYGWESIGKKFEQILESITRSK